VAQNAGGWGDDAAIPDRVDHHAPRRLATVRPDGTPQVNPTWVRFDGTYLWLTTTSARQKTRNWQHATIASSGGRRRAPAS
jgi:hypothetical protein